MKICWNCKRTFRGEKDFLFDTSRWHQGQRRELWFNCSCGSIIKLKRGQFDWYSPEKLLSPDAKEVFNRLAVQKEIADIPAVITEITQVLENSESNPEEIAAEIKKQPILAADVLSLANLMKRAEETRIATLEHAVVYLGRTILMSLVTVALLKRIEFRSSHFTQDMFWHESIISGRIGEELVAALNLPFQSDEVYIASSLANVGKVVGAISMPEVIDNIYILCQESGCDWTAAEFSLGAPHHTTMGEIACVFWALPEYVKQANIHHHDGGSHGHEGIKMVDVVKMATQMTHFLLGNKNRIDTTILEESRKVLKLDEKLWEELLDKMALIPMQVKTFITR